MTRVPPSRFDDLYRDDPDPWGFETRWYESRKYALTVASLPRQRYASAFEAGCSIGVLSAHLSTRCDHMIVADSSAAAVQRARQRLAGSPHVDARRLVLPEQWPDGPFDLVVLSEIGYYFDEVELGVLLDAAERSMQPGGDLVAVHWRGRTDYPQNGDRVHDLLRSRPNLTSTGRWSEPEFLLDSLRLHTP